MDSTNTPLAIYIHWPYCARICPYCDFNVYKARDDKTLAAAISHDLTHWRELSGARRITSLHFGGGTPSLMRASDIGDLLAHIDRLWGLPDTAEIAIEANPGDANTQTWKALSTLGVNRLSLGAQSFHDPALRLLGRDHSGAQSRAALDMALNIFPSVSLDLIFGWIGQTASLWQDDLEQALESRVPHVSAYQLTIEPGTAFAMAEARGISRASDEITSADFYEQAASALDVSGYEHYEVSNFAKPKHKSRHNLAYWKGLDYVGVGPGAHGRIEQAGVRHATVAHMRPEVYAQHVSGIGHGIADNERLSRQAWGEEYILMGLRISDGISLDRYAQITGQTLPQDAIENLIQSGHLAVQNNHLSAAPKGRLVLNHITEALLVT